MSTLSITKKTIMGMAVAAMSMGLGCSKSGGGTTAVAPTGCGITQGTACPVGSSYGLGVLLANTTGTAYLNSDTGYSSNYDYNYRDNYNTSQLQYTLRFYATESSEIQNLTAYQDLTQNGNGNNRNLGMPNYSGQVASDGIIRIGNSYSGTAATGTCQLDHGDYSITVQQNGVWRSSSSNNSWNYGLGSTSAQISNLKLRATHATTGKYIDFTIQNGRVDSTYDSYNNGSNNNSMGILSATAYVDGINGQNCGQLSIDFNGGTGNGGSCDPRYYDCGNGYTNNYIDNAVGGLVDYFLPTRQ